MLRKTYVTSNVALMCCYCLAKLSSKQYWRTIKAQLFELRNVAGAE